ncbi:MAG: alpha-galactosidase [Oscillospiraceae bacterium]|nr:alpha-galactosidase [Oscillospiraceae bacterium]
MIIYLENERQFQLNTPHASYVLTVAEEGYLLHTYWGKRIAPQDLTDLLRLGDPPFVPAKNERERASFLDCAPFEYPCAGIGDYREPAIVLEDGAFACDLRYVSHRIYSGKYTPRCLPHTWGNGCETLEILMRDEPTGLEVKLHYTVFDGLDAVIRSVSLENCGSRDLMLRRVLSASVDLDDDRFEMITLYGSWARERQAERLPIRHGKQRIDSTRGESSHQYSPFFALVCPETTEESGEAYGFTLIYSGNFTAQAELTQFCQTRAQIGIEAGSFAHCLSTESEFDAPEAVLVYSEDGIGGMSRTFHRLFCDHLIRSRYRYKERPVLINNWEATYFDFDLEKLKTIADEASRLGIELFVLDDGWFGRRDSDNCSLGDWVPDQRKLPGGLKPLTDHITGKGMRFGLWFEPEMISPDSDLFRSHPDYAVGIEGRPRTQSRAQYVLNYTRRDVRDAVWAQMKEILDTVPVSYIKWDMNRQLTEVPSPAFYHAYMLGVYQMLERLVTEYPDILLESCSGGGARFDPGMLYYSPQIWASDDTDAKERLRIQYGASLFMPPSAVGSHVSVCPNHATGRVTPFETRANVAMFGTFGYELNVAQLSDDEKAQIPAQIARWHSISHLIREGSLYRLGNPFAPTGYAAQQNADYDAWIFVAADQSDAVFTYVQITAEANMKSRRIRLAGLLPDAVYAYELGGKAYQKTGAYLMQCGVMLPNLWGDMTSVQIRLRTL